MHYQVEEECHNPNSVKRTPGGKQPQMWGQSLYVVANLIKEVGSTSIALRYFGDPIKLSRQN
jgi:hypothetical protein